MKENAPKKTWFQTLRTLWVPLAIGVVTVAALAVVVGMVWKDYRTAMMDSQTRQMELVVQSTADSIRVLLEEYADRLDSIAGKAEASKAFRPTVARSDTIRDVWLENSNGEVIYSCYGLSAVCDVLITRTEDISYWQYHSGDEHYLVMKKKAGGETACLVVDSTVMYQQLISEIHVGRNGYIMIKNDDNLVVMHPEAVQWGIKVVEGRQRIYQGKELDMSSLSELLRAQQEEESGTLDYYSYWWADPALPRVHKISAFRHLDVGGSFWIVSAVVDYDDFYEPVQQSFVKVVLIFGGVALVLVLFMFQMFRLQERDRRSATEISDLKTLNQTLEELHRSEESLAHGQRLQMMGTLTGGIAHEFNNFLTPITGYADLIMADADPGSEIYDNAMEISEAAQKAQEVVKQISSMSRKNVETVYDAVSAEGLLHRTRKLVETNCPKNVELKEENELSGECVLGNATQLQQVLLNISINAIHAIGTEGGKLTIRGSVVPRSELAALFPEEKISEEWSSYVCLSVTDTGCGMDKETMQHIFEPFFTTKKTGEGTGLGLALADQIIRTHRGRIRAESTIGRGTTFLCLSAGAGAAAGARTAAVGRGQQAAHPCGGRQQQGPRPAGQRPQRAGPERVHLLPPGRAAPAAGAAALRRPRHRREPDEQQRRGSLHGHPGPLPGHDPHRDDQCPHKRDRGRPQPRRHRRLCGKTGVGVYAAGPDTEQPERVSSAVFREFVKYAQSYPS